MTDENKKIREKIAELSKRISACDWTPDKNYTLKGHPVPYVSGQKIKRVTRPILNELGILFVYRMADVQTVPACGVKDNHVHIRAFIDLIDVESGETMSYPVISEGADAGDKAILSGSAYAKRMFWITNFDIIDGLETNEDEGSVSSSDVVANLRRQAIPENETPSQQTVQQTAAAPVQQTPPAEKITSPGEGNLAKMQVRAMDNALEAIRKADEEGRIMHDWYVKAKSIREKAACMEDVQSILDIRRQLNL